MSAGLVGRSRAPSVTRRPIITRSKWDLLPGGHMVRGAQLNQFQSVTGLAAWAGAVPEDGGPTTDPWNKAIANWWTQWPWDNQIRPQIQAMAAYPFNGMRFFVSTTCRYPASGYSPQLDTPTFLARFRQLITYAQSVGVRSYPCLAVDSQMFGNQTETAGVMGGYMPTKEWVIDEFKIICRFLSRHADAVYGVDFLNEGNNGWRASHCAPVYQAVKAVAPTLKYAWSGGNLAPPANGGPPPFDIYDHHIYADGIGPEASANYSILHDCPSLIGETGQVFATDRAPRYNQAKDIVNYVAAGGQRGAGVQFWDLFGSWGGGQWGVLNNDLTPRADVQAIILSLPN